MTSMRCNRSKKNLTTVRMTIRRKKNVRSDENLAPQMKMDMTKRQQRKIVEKTVHASNRTTIPKKHQTPRRAEKTATLLQIPILMKRPSRSGRDSSHHRNLALMTTMKTTISLEAHQNESHLRLTMRKQMDRLSRNANGVPTRPRKTLHQE